MSAQPQNLKHQRPPSGLTGFASAWTHLDRVENDRQRLVLGEIVRRLGVQGAPGLGYAAWQCVWLTGLRTDPPVARKALRAREREYVERRVREELSAVRGQDAKLFPRLKKL